MKRIVLFLLLYNYSSIVMAQDSIVGNRLSYCYKRYKEATHTANLCNDNPWMLVFEDEFDKNGLDTTSIWSSKLEDKSHMRPKVSTGELHEQQYYTFNENYIIKDGKLKIIAEHTEPFDALVFDWMRGDSVLQDSITNLRQFHYTSANIRSLRKFPFCKIEAKVKLPKGKGFWPAFWMYSSQAQPYCELDVFEFWNEWRNGQIDYEKLSKIQHMTSHYHYIADTINDKLIHQCSSDVEGNDYSLDFHTFTTIWDEDKIVWLVDDDVKCQRSKKYTFFGCNIVKGTKYWLDLTQPEFPMNIIFNLAIQGDALHNHDSPDATTSFPGEMQIEWIKVYKRTEMLDVLINNQNDLPIDDNTLFHSISGNSVSFCGPYSIEEGQQLAVTADELIVLKSGFVASEGSWFSASIEHPKRDKSSERGNTEEYENNEDFIEHYSAKQEDGICVYDNTDGINKLSSSGFYSQKSGFFVFPNPTNGNLKLILPSCEQSYDIKITNVYGTIVYTQHTHGINILPIDIANNCTGLYQMHIISNDNDQNQIFKIVKL